MKVMIDGIEYVPKNGTNDMVGFFDNNLWGKKEWEPEILDIQKWYYGSVVKAAWCATALSYVADRCGLLDAIGGKNENVYLMMEACKKSSKGRFIEGSHMEIERGDVCFFCFDEEMSITSSKHVGLAYWKSAANEKILVIGGNQNDKVSRKFYDRKYLVGIFRLEV